ncbi:glycine betaine ABC transporter substrate-binding protein [Actinomycetospora sp. NBRC 106378]|uniref:ABC transporter substrate-binding protein n=1 Tax=Actinomycetospora sp. NBRC 106378 TaxID=3032208 RepID=UPI0024A090B9|nr:glycine betaine ABC transporter substrate-binding protein [Actinomycetospora sp. NBRC 106378]GLZ51963.1 ABC transporter substrate-binding protein [Actinomycetospora sp. NBRC 106378]
MSTTTTGGRLGRLSLVGVAAAGALFLAACGGGGSSSSAPSSAAPSSTSSIPADAASVTATPGSIQLPAGTPGAGKPAIVIGDKNFPEEFVLGELYRQALAAKGYVVSIKSNIGGSELIDTALSSNQIEMYPEYLGEIVTSVAKENAPTSASGTYQAAKQFEESQRQSTVLLQTPFQDVDTVIVPNAYAQQHGLVSVGDLTKVGPGGAGATIAGPVEFKTRQTGFLGMQQQYGLTQMGYLPVQAGAQYTAIDQGTAQAADAFSTDYQLLSNKYTALSDPKGIFGFQYVAPVVKQSVVQAEGPEFTQTLNWVSSLLSTQAIQALNSAVQGHGAQPADVAAQFLAANGLK